ncbi:probable cytochrome P450 6a14 [Photinus pyralis]|uniref:probable cytochrome P450 6a14 n=1 Tax=Photinus pyralis TaxID=7054 RepID=UPI0012677449|nr:probable cytochrome P450 6a14 [Photinus pyralis]
MALTSGSVYTDLLTLVVAGLIFVYAYFKWTFTYWARKGLPHLKPSFPSGTMQNPVWPKISLGETLMHQYRECKEKGLKHIGLFTFSRPNYMPIDLQYVKNILSSDFNYFVDRGVYYNEKVDPLSAHLFSLEGQKWKNLRSRLTPTFSSGKMKMMFRLVMECGKHMTSAMEEVARKQIPIETKDWLGRFGTDVIGTCAFGIDCNSFQEPNSAFRTYGKRALCPTKWEIAKTFLGFANEKFARRMSVRITPVDVTAFFLNIVEETVKHREENNVQRNDFLQILLELKDSVGENDANKSLTIEELTAQAFIFFLAGFETSATTMSFCLYELAENLHIQDKLREEVETVLERYDGELCYDAIKELKYMKQVIDETLRKHPPLQLLLRMCVQDYKVPGTDFTIEKGTAVSIPVQGLHYDPDYFPEPEKFDPDRFSEENRRNIKPFTYMPFGEGPRMCIGLRFGLMQVSVGLALLLKNFRFTLHEKTPLPLQMNPRSFLLSTLDDIYLNVEKV